MADQFDEPLIETSPDLLVDLGVARIREDFPNWKPAQAGFTSATLGANAVIIAELRDIASIVPRAIFRIICAALFGILPDDATPASATVTVYATDTKGYQFDAGAQFTIASSGDRSEGFELEGDLVIPVGSDHASGTLTAILTGAQGSGQDGVVLPVQAFSWFDHAVLAASTAGGQDAEEDQAFLDRASQQLEALRWTLTLARDVPAFARRTPGVFRVYVLDNYNPADGTTNNEKMCAVYPLAADGTDVPAPTATALQNDLQTLREANFQFPVRNPTRTNVKVKYWIAVRPGFDQAAVLAACDEALTAHLNPANWGLDPTSSRPTWDVTAIKVRRTKLIQIIENVDGVDYIPIVSGSTGVQLAKGTDALAFIGEVVLDGPAPLPNLTSLEHAVAA